MRLFRTVFHAMASEHELQLWCDDEARARRAADAAIADVARVEAKYSRYRDDSVTSQINRAAGGDAVTIDSETAALLSYADHCHRLSDGRFDLTSGVLRRAWDFRRVPPRIPDAAVLASATALIGWNRVEWNGLGACPTSAWKSTSAASAGNTRQIAPRPLHRAWRCGAGCCHLGGDVRNGTSRWRHGVSGSATRGGTGTAIATVLLEARGRDGLEITALLEIDGRLLPCPQPARR
jgi:hypothetical protein